MYSMGSDHTDTEVYATEELARARLLQAVKDAEAKGYKMDDGESDGCFLVGSHDSLSIAIEEKDLLEAVPVETLIE